MIPLRVALMDDDPCALKWNAGLLARDVRTVVCLEAESPQFLLAALAHRPAHALLYDVEYHPPEPGLEDAIRQALEMHPHLCVICLSQYGETGAVQAALLAGARGFLLKSEARLEIASAVVRAVHETAFIVTPGVLPAVSEVSFRLGLAVECLPVWRLPPAITPQLGRVLTLRLLYGMSAPMAARELLLAEDTIEKYTQALYRRLQGDYYDERDLAGLDLERLTPELRAFQRLALPPRRDNE